MLQVDAYQLSILKLKEKVLPMGGFWWQLLSKSTPGLTWNPFGIDPRKTPPNKMKPPTPSECKATLREFCVPEPSQWSKCVDRALL